MLAAALMINMLTMGVGQVITLYVLNSPFCWPSIEIGYFIGTRFMLLGLGAALGIKFLGKCMPEYFVAVAGLLSYASFYVLLAFAKTKSLLYIGLFTDHFLMYVSIDKAPSSRPFPYASIFYQLQELMKCLKLWGHDVSRTLFSLRKRGNF